MGLNLRLDSTFIVLKLYFPVKEIGCFQGNVRKRSKESEENKKSNVQCIKCTLSLFIQIYP